MFRVSGKWIKVGNAWAGVQSVGRRHYQCEHGVYGYRPKKAEAFERKFRLTYTLRHYNIAIRSARSAIRLVVRMKLLLLSLPCGGVDL